VRPNTPALAAGIKSNDVIIEIAGRRAETQRTLTSVVQSRQPGETVPVVLLRGGQKMTLQVKLGENVQLRREDVLGMGVQRLDQQESAALGLPAGTGVRVLAVDARGITSGSLQEGDVIALIAAPKRTPATPDTLRAFEERIKRGGRGQLIIVRDGEPFALNF
jgi:serine protease Do